VLQQLMRKWQDNTMLDDETMAAECRTIYLQVLNQQREWLREWNKEHQVDEDAVRRHLHRLDLEEEKLRFMQ